MGHKNLLALLQLANKTTSPEDFPPPKQKSSYSQIILLSAY